MLSVELLLHRYITVKRPLCDRRKIGQKQQNMPKIRLRRTILPSHIDHIAYSRQRIKGYPERHDDLSQKIRPHMQGILQKGNSYDRIFIKNKQSQIQDNIQNLHPFSFFRKCRP